MKSEDFLKSMGNVPQTYIDELTQWQQAKTPLSEADGAPQDEALTLPHTGKEEKTMKHTQTKRTDGEMPVRKLMPITIGVFASLAACAVLVLHLGRQANDPMQSVSVANGELSVAEVDEPEVTTTAEAPVSWENQDEVRECCTFYGTGLDIPQEGFFRVIRTEEEGRALAAQLETEQELSMLTDFSLHPDSAILVAGLPQAYSACALRYLAYDATGTLMLNFAVYHDGTSFPAEAMQQYFMMPVAGGLPYHDRYRISYTVYDSEFGTPLNAEDIPREPAQTEYDFAASMGKDILQYKDAALYPVTAVQMHSHSAGEADLGEQGIRFAYLNADGSGDWSPETWLPEALCTRINSCIDGNHTALLLVTNTQSTDTLAHFGDLTLAGGRLSVTFTEYLPEVYNEMEGLYASLYLFEQDVTFGPQTAPQLIDLDIVRKTVNVTEEYGDQPGSFSEFYRSLPRIALPAEEVPVMTSTSAAQIPETTETTPVLTEPPADDPAQDPTRHQAEQTLPADAKLPENILTDLSRAPANAAAVDPELQSIVFSNQFLADVLGIWLVPDDALLQEICEMTDRLSALEELEPIDTPDVVGGGFLVRLIYPDGSFMEYEVGEDLLRISGGNASRTWAYWMQDSSGTVKDIALKLQKAQAAYEADIDAVRAQMG